MALYQGIVNSAGYKNKTHLEKYFWLSLVAAQIKKYDDSVHDCFTATHGKRRIVTLFAIARIYLKFRSTRCERSSQAPVQLYSLSFEMYEVKKS